MKKDHLPVCPGCSRHCPAGAVRCKYGRTYFAKHPPVQTDCPRKPKEHKWKSCVEKEGLLWTYLLSGKKIKKALCHRHITETELLAALTEEEKQALHGLLSKLRTAADQEK